jgi:hypothetical protein
MDSFFSLGFVCGAVDLLGRATDWVVDRSFSGSLFICWTDWIVVSHFDSLDYPEILDGCGNGIDDCLNAYFIDK